MIRAAIDIGSNTVQMLAGETINGRVKIAHQYLYTTRLGESDRKNILSEKSIISTVMALKEIKEVLNNEGIFAFKAVATSAVRDAINKEEFLVKAEKSLGEKVRILSGKEEAYLSYLGASSYFTENEPLVLDIGGGSTEIIWQENRTLSAISLNIGAVRAYNNGWSQEEIREKLKQAVLPQKKNKLLVAVGGTATAAVGIKKNIKTYSRELIEGESLSQDDLKELIDTLTPLTIDERCSFSPLLEKRGEVIIEGLWILLGIMEIMKKERVYISDAGILDGILLDWQLSENGEILSFLT